MAELISDLSILEALPDLPQPAAQLSMSMPAGRSIYIESYGCQMNFSDSEIVMSIMAAKGYTVAHNVDEADLVLLNTCAIRDNAEQKIRHRLQSLKPVKRAKPALMVGILGCMAERLKAKLLDEEKLVDLVVGPDAYRTLPELVEQADSGQKGVNVFLSREETYGEIDPVRLNSNGVTAFISIMRGCDNMCSFCVVPFTRGRERSRDVHSIVHEAERLYHQGYREVTLLGQNVDSYKHIDLVTGERINFARLLELTAQVSPDLRVRFSTSHPKDMTDEVLETMGRYENICKYIHLPAQSGNSRVLDAMNRTYDREWYMGRVEAIRRILGESCAISTDIITGFCTETEAEHLDTLTLMEAVGYDYAYMFAYSERPGTLAAKKFVDDVPEEVKKRRLQEVIEIVNRTSLERKQARVGQTFKVLIEGPSRKGNGQLCGRNDQNDMIVFEGQGHTKGQYVYVTTTSCTSATLHGEIAELELA